MAETKPMTMSDLGKRPADHTAAAPVHPATAPGVASDVVDPKKPLVKPATKVAEPLVGEVLPPETAAPPSPSQAEADAIRMGKRNRDATAEAPATGYKTR